MNRVGLLRRLLILAALLCLVAANAVPAFRLAGDMMFGFQASYLEFVAIGRWGRLEQGQCPAAALGIIANLGFLTTFIAVSCGRSKLAKGTAVMAAASAFGSVGFLATGSERFVPNLGCLLWLATGLLVVLGSFARSPTGKERLDLLRKLA
jgi:hypothetical protein